MHKQLPRILIYTALITLTLILPYIKLHSKPIVSTLPARSISSQQKPLKQASFVLASQLSTIYVAPVIQAPVVSSVANCGDNAYMNYIYEHESGCTLTAVNASSGDYGIGQSASGLSTACPDWQTDYACQNAFFDAYAISRYGSDYNAYEHEVSDGWW